jgi:glycosyltransferase involved in cell wall biosynthesis
VTVALLTTYLAGYRMPLYERLARELQVEVLCYGGAGRYIPPWFTNLEEQLASAPFPARRLHGAAEALGLGRRYEAIIAPYAGGAILPAAYAGARLHRRAFVLWASVWAQPRSLSHALAMPLTRRMYRHADSVIAYGEHVRRFVAARRGHDEDVFVAPQSVEPDLFRRPVEEDELLAFRERHHLPAGPLVLCCGRLVAEKGVEVLADAWPLVTEPATLVVVGEGPLRDRLAALERCRVLGALPRPELPVAYRAAELTVLASLPTPRFREPWGLVCNESMHQARPVVASSAVGAVAGGLVRDGDTGLVVTPGDRAGLAAAIGRLLSDEPLRHRLGAAAQSAAEAHTYEAMTEAFSRALATAMRPSPTGP